MSNPPPPRTSWSSQLVLSLVYLVLGATGFALALTSDSPAGALLFGLAGLLLVANAIGQLLRRPRLELVDDDLVIGTLTGRRTVIRADVVEVRVLTISRIGRRTHVLRLEYRTDGDPEHLDVFTKADLGTDPRDVAEILWRRGFPGGSRNEG